MGGVDADEYWTCTQAGLSRKSAHTYKDALPASMWYRELLGADDQNRGAELLEEFDHPLDTDFRATTGVIDKEKKWNHLRTDRAEKAKQGPGRQMKISHGKQRTKPRDAD